jgi:hypothetical protein
MFDIAQAAIGMDGSGPCEIIPKGYQGNPYMTFKYQTGVVMTEQPYLDDNPTAQGIKFIGDKGWIEVARGYIACSDPTLIPAEIAGTRPQPRTAAPAAGAPAAAATGRNAAAAAPAATGRNAAAAAPAATGRNATAPAAGQPAPTAAGLQYEISSPHMQNFIDSVRSRQKPIATIEKGCSTAIVCCLGNIANELKRPIKWDPATYTFIDDKEATAHRLMGYEYRAPYHL